MKKVVPVISQILLATLNLVFSHAKVDRRQLRLLMFASVAFLFSGCLLHAQTGSITGTVVDPSGAAIPGAQVQVINQATGDLTREATSDASGNFRALNVPPATYKITVAAPGMQELDRS